jgi:hypothetical protein
MVNGPRANVYYGEQVIGRTDSEPGKFIAGDFIAIAGEMHQFPASNENTVAESGVCTKSWSNSQY